MPLTCTPKSLPKTQLVAAAEIAVAENPVNAPPDAGMMFALVAPTRERLAVLTTKYWGAKGVKLTVSFLERRTAALERMILAHMNAWRGSGKTAANVQFLLTKRDGDVRIAFLEGPAGGYWSYPGTDIRLIPAGEPTLNLEGFTDRTRVSEFKRVVRHEAGHTLGFPHEHARRALVELLDVDKALAYFMATQGWSEAEVRAQVLTPLEEAALGPESSAADATSVMAYQIPGELTKSGEPILGGTDINALDRKTIAKIYPKRGGR